MTQSTNRVLDDLAKLMTDAAGAAQGVRQEVEGVMRAQAERILKTMDVVTREEFEAVEAMAEKAARRTSASRNRLAGALRRARRS